MEKLTKDVMDTTGLEPSIAKAAIGYVLLFLRDEAPQGHIAEFIDKMPKAREAVEAASARGDGGVTVAIEGLTSLMGRGRFDTNILAGRLMNLGLDEKQIVGLIRETLSRAEDLLGADGVARIRQALPSLEERLAASAHRSGEASQPEARSI
jgi:hypothetical protein